MYLSQFAQKLYSWKIQCIVKQWDTLYMFISNMDLNLDTYDYKEFLIYLSTWWTFKSHIECKKILYCTEMFLHCIPVLPQFQYQYPFPITVKTQPL